MEVVLVLGVIAVVVFLVSLLGGGGKSGSSSSSFRDGGYGMDMPSGGHGGCGCHH